jgi:hypothetical protein
MEYKTSLAKREAQKKYREANRDYYVEYAKRYNPRYCDMNREQRKEYAKAYHLKKVNTFEGRTLKIFQGAKGRATKAGIEFTIAYEDIDWVNVCPLLEIPIVYDYAGALQWDSPSLDRVDSTKGYVKGNVRVVSRRANTLKNCGTVDEIEMLGRNIRGYAS